MGECIFCRIAAGEVPSARLHEDERTFAFLDINPLAPGHALVIPKGHAAKLTDAPAEDAAAVTGRIGGRDGAAWPQRARMMDRRRCLRMDSLRLQ